MSRIPTARPPHGRAPSADAESRRASTHSLNLSYAYGAPSHGTTQGSNAPSSSQQRRQNSLGPEAGPSTYTGQGLRQQNTSTAGSTSIPVPAGGSADGGRAAEPAAVRYARLAQRKKDTGGNAYPPPAPVVGGSYSGLQNTSVNIANAFKAATSGLGGVVTGGRREDFVDDDEEEADEGVEEADHEENDQENPDGPPAGDEDRTVGTGEKAPNSAVRKRKKHAHRDPTYQEQPEQSASSDDSELDLQRGQKKRTKVHSDDNDHVDDPAALNKPRRRAQKSTDPTYRPAADPTFRAGQTTTSDSEADTPKRRRSKGKGRASTGGRSLAQEAIPRGIKDGEIWYGKKRKARRSSRTPAAGDEASNAGDGDDHGERAGADLGGMDPAEHDQHEPGDDGTPPAATYFLRLKSPSPQRDHGDGRADARPAPAASPSTSRPSVDPAFAAFDQSVAAGQDSNNLTASFDDSVLRGSSYDYSEEERIMQALEAQKRARIAEQQQQSARQPEPQPTPKPKRNPAVQQLQRVSHLPTPQGSAGHGTPVISNGGYPATPNAGVDSPVAALRKRRLPAPPSMLGAGTPLGPPGDRAEEHDDLERHRQLGSRIGRRCGDALKPLFRLAGSFWRRSQDPLLNWPRILKAAAVAAVFVSLLVAALYHEAIPFPSHSRAEPAYTAPSALPDSLEGVVARLAKLENAMGRLSTSAGTDRQQAASDRKTAKELQNAFRELEHSVHEDQSRSREALAAIDQSVARQAKQNEQATRSVRTDVGALKARLEQTVEKQKVDTNAVTTLRGEVADIASGLSTVRTQVDKVSRDLASSTDADRITKLALEAIGKKLPGKIAVWMDDSGRLDIDPSFWRVLKDAFVDKKTVEKTVDAKLGSFDASKRGGFFDSAKEGKPAATDAVPALPSWDTFLAQNEEALKTWVASDLSSRTGNDAFVSKRTFLDILDRKLKSLQRDFEAKANDNFEEMGREVLAKVARQEEMRRKQESSSGARDASTSTGRTMTIQGSDGQNVTAVISTLVDSALLRYSKDVLGRPDYALYTAGGRVIRSLTSPSYEPYKLGRVRSAAAWVTGATVPQSRPPVTALHPDTSPGACWPFAGPHGQIGIQLSRRVVPTDITLEHISPDVALGGDVSSAPKDFEVWGIVDVAEQIPKVAQYRQEQLQAKRAARAAGSTLEDDLDSPPASVPESANHILLASGTYDPSAPSHVQSFPVSAPARQLGIPIQVVVVKILSNHGESAYTCLYRVRVSGTTEHQLEASASTS